MTDMLLAVVFGLCTIATVFVFFGWMKVLRGPDAVDSKYFYSALGIMTANIGVMMLCANRATAFLGLGEFYPYMLILPALIILTGKTLWLYGATLGHGKRPVVAYAAFCAAWIGFCLWRFL
jgi:hypothetical protein